MKLFSVITRYPDMFVQWENDLFETSISFGELGLVHRRVRVTVYNKLSAPNKEFQNLKAAGSIENFLRNNCCCLHFSPTHCSNFWTFVDWLTQSSWLVYSYSVSLSDRVQACVWWPNLIYKTADKLKPDDGFIGGGLWVCQQHLLQLHYVCPYGSLKMQQLLRFN